MLRKTMFIIFLIRATCKRVSLLKYALTLSQTLSGPNVSEDTNVTVAGQRVINNVIQQIAMPVTIQ